MLDVNDLEIGKVYYVEVDGDGLDHWLFKKDVVSPRTNVEAITSCRCCMCLDNRHYNNGGASCLCRDNQIRDLRIANPNYIAIWNRTFSDNIKCLEQ